MVVLARPVAPCALRGQRESNLTTRVDTAKPVTKAAIRIRKVKRNASHVPLAPPKGAPATQHVICVHSVGLTAVLEMRIANVRNVIKVITETLEGIPAAKLVQREHIKP